MLSHSSLLVSLWIYALSSVMCLLNKVPCKTYLKTCNDPNSKSLITSSLHTIRRQLEEEREVKLSQSSLMALESQGKKKEEERKKSYSPEALKTQIEGEMKLPQRAKPAKARKESACTVEMKERYTYVAALI